MDRKVTSRILAGVGILIFVLLIQTVGYYRLLGSAWPSVTAVAEYASRPSVLSLLARATTKTMTVVAGAYGLGCLIAVVVSAVAHLNPVLRPGFDRLATFLNAIPAVAVAPILIILTTNYVAGVSLAALYVFFIVYMASTAGLDGLPKVYRDLFSVLGASKLKRFLRFDLIYALPFVLNGMKQAVPAAIVGAILAEWFSGSGGLGVVILSAMRNVQITLLWSAMLSASFMALILYAVIGGLERLARSRIL
jgi:ABC-type nitrate/sulfonate/bicarbonate transport system permease component